MFQLWPEAKVGWVGSLEVVILGVMIVPLTFSVQYLICDMAVGGRGSNPRFVAGITVSLSLSE